MGLPERGQSEGDSFGNWRDLKISIYQSNLHFGSKSASTGQRGAIDKCRNLGQLPDALFGVPSRVLRNRRMRPGSCCDCI